LIKRGIGILLFVVSAIFAVGQISIKATVDSTGMLIGDQQQLHLTIQHPSTATVQSFYASALDTIENLEIIDETEWVKSGTEPITIQKDITISIFDSGYYFIPRMILRHLRPFEKLRKNQLLLKISCHTYMVYSD